MNYKTNHTVVLTLLFFLLASDEVYAAKQKNVIVENRHADLLQSALQHGGTIVKQMKHVTIIRCEEEVMAALNLEEDLPVHVVSAAANTQVRANLVHNEGNTGKGRKVVVLDTGINYLHIDLASSYIGGWDFVNNDNDPLDDNGHGSHVAGLITGDGDNTFESRGVAADVGIIAGKVVSSNGTGSLSDLIEAIYWAVDGQDGIYGTADDWNADAISISIGTSPPNTYTKNNCDDIIPIVKTAIDYAVSRNVAVVIAAGNSGKSGVSIPGCISIAITVGAVQAKDELASFSGQGKSVDVLAPGVNLLSAWSTNQFVYSSGTSMSTPIVSGTIALIKAAHPNYTVSEAITALRSTAVGNGKGKLHGGYGDGRIDAYAAVNFDILRRATSPLSENEEKIKTFSLFDNYPNPFNPSTSIRYGLPDETHVTLSVYNTLGQRVALLVDEKQEAGYHEISFNATGLPSGVYFYRLQAGSHVETKKLLLMK